MFPQVPVKMLLQKNLVAHAQRLAEENVVNVFQKALEKKYFLISMGSLTAKNKINYLQD